MNMKRIVIYCAVLLLCSPLYGGIETDLIAHWRFSEGEGTTVNDHIGGNHGTLMGDATWTDGMIGGAVILDGVGDYVDCGNADIYNTATNAVTLAAWFLADMGGATSWSGLIMRGGPNTDTFALYYNRTAQTLGFKTSGTSNAYVLAGAEDLFDSEWHHTAATYNGATKIIYLDAEQMVSVNASGSIESSNGRVLLGAGRDTNPPAPCAVGKIDDARIYTRGLSQEEIGQLMVAQDTPPSVALEPNPVDAAEDVPRDVILNWRPGKFAATHDVYLGTTFDDVNEGNTAVLVSQGQDANSYDAGVLEFNQTYYWRIDEVNAAPDNTIFKGAVWSFTTEPVAYPIEGVIATSNADPQVGAGPENTVNGSGLNADDQHSTKAPDMFLGVPGADPIYLQYEFDNVYKLHEMLIWNYNVEFELLLGFGIKDVTVEYSENGVDWAVLGDAVLAQATAQADYLYNTTIDFGGVAAQYVKLTVNSGFGMMGQYGLSEVRFMQIPAQAREPQPADGATDMSVDTMLGWRAGRDAISHEVYFGTDPNALPLAATVDTPSYSGALDLGTTYYWKIDEIQDAESWESAVWSFSTQAYVVVEDFESYDDDENRIYETWIDGYEAPDNGSQVGHLEAPFAETTIVHGGKQSMPLFYDNTGIATSEAELALTQNWTANGIKSLSLYFRGAEGNTGQLYLKINDAKVQYDGGVPLTRPWFTQWTIDLASVGGNLSNVTSLTIGVEGAGASGVVYIDDIQLHPAGASEPPAAQDPGSENLVAHYALDNDTTDSSGQGNHGVAVGDPVYAAGISGMAMDFDGIDDRVDLGPLDVVGGGITLSLWLKPESFVYVDTRVLSKTVGTAGNDHWWMMSTDGDQHRLRFRLKTDDGQDTTTLRDKGSVPEGEWTYAAATWDGATMRVYQNLQEVASTAKGGAAVAVDASVNAAIGNQPADAGDKHWDGLIDEVRLYNRGLSEAELLYLASVQ